MFKNLNLANLASDLLHHFLPQMFHPVSSKKFSECL